jgi:hypothetical protein
MDTALWSRKVFKAVLAGRWVAYTLDHWTSDKKDNYMGLTVSFINDKFVMETVTLACHKHEGSACGENIHAFFKAELSKLGLDPKLCVAVVCDTAAVMGTFGSILEADPDFGERGLGIFQPCAAHTIDLTAKMVFVGDIAGCAALAALMTKLRLIVGHFKSSSQASDGLKDVQIKLGLNDYVVIQDVKTRWWSSEMMVTRIRLLQLPLQSFALAGHLEAHLTLTGAEWDMMKELQALLHLSRTSSIT